MSEILGTMLKAGVMQYSYWEDFLNSPVGIIWITFAYGQNKKKIALLLNVITTNFYRRKGVATKLLKHVLNEVDVIITGSGSAEGGEELLKNFGFKYDDTLNLWFFIKEG